jgi:hypothetical protein
MEIRCLQGGQDVALRAWWDEWSHNIAASLPPARGIGSIFLVCEETGTEAFSNCYYAGSERGTSLAVEGTAHVLPGHGVTLNGNFKSNEVEGGPFGFKSGSRQHFPNPESEKWSIFFRHAGLLSIFSLARFMVRARSIWQ